MGSGVTAGTPELAPMSAGRLALIRRCATRRSDSGVWRHRAELLAEVDRLTRERDQARADVAFLNDMLGAIWLYVNWRYVTKQLTTPQKERWADAIERAGHPDGGTQADRWWRDDAPITYVQRGFDAAGGDR